MYKNFNFAKFFFLALSAVAISPIVTQAATIQTYYLENVQLAEGGTITGHFTFDTTQFEDYATNYSLTVSGVSAPNYNGTLDSSNSAVHPSSGVGPLLLQVISTSASSTWPSFINLPFKIALTSIPLVDPLDLSSGFNYINNTPPSGSINIISGDVTTRDPNSIPEPTTITMILSGVVGFGLSRKKAN